MDEAILWAVGAMLDDVFGGQPTPEFTSKEEAFVASLLGNIVGASDKIQPVTGIDWIIERCADSDPNRRFETGQALAAAIRAWLDGQDPEKAVAGVGNGLVFWRLGMKGSVMLRSLSSSRRAAVQANELFQNRDDAPQPGNALRTAIGFAHGAIVLLDQLKASNPLAEVEVPAEVVEHYRNNFYRLSDASPEEAAKLGEYADMLMNAVKEMLARGACGGGED